MKSDYSFKPIEFTDAKTTVKAPVAASVHKSSQTRVTIRIDAATAKKCGFKDKDVLTPFVDLENRTVLLLSDQRPVPLSARRLHVEGNRSNCCKIEYPRTNGFDEIFDVSPIRAMILREASHGRLVFSVPKLTR